MCGLMNRLFKMTVHHDKAFFAHKTSKLLSKTGAQSTLYQDLAKQE